MKKIFKKETFLKTSLEADQYKNALKLLDQTITSQPSNHKAYMEKGICLYSLERTEEAIPCFNKAISLNSKFPEAFYHKGVALNELGKHLEAIKCYDFAILLNPKYAEAFNNKGLILSDLGKHTEAISCFDKAISINEKFADAFYNKGITLESLGKKEEAIKFYDKTIAINPKDASVYNNRGVILQYLERFQEAIESFDKATSLDPKYAIAFSNKGITLRSSGKNQEAIECFDKAISLNPKYATAINNKGISLYCLGQKQEALECFDDAISLNSNYANALTNKGTCLYDLGNIDEALSCYNKAITTNPNDALSLCYRGLAFSRQEKTSEALADFNKAIKLTSNNKSGTNAKALNEALMLIVELQDISSKIYITDLDERETKTNSHVSCLIQMQPEKNKLIKQVLESCQKNANKSEHRKYITNLLQLINQFKELSKRRTSTTDEHPEISTSISSLSEINEERSFMEDAVFENYTLEYETLLREELERSSRTKEDKAKIEEYYSAFVETFSSVYSISQFMGYEQFKIDNKKYKASVLSGVASFADFIDEDLFSRKMELQDFIRSLNIRMLTNKVKKLANNKDMLVQMIGKIGYSIATNVQKQKVIIRQKTEDLQEIYDALTKKISKFCSAVEENFDENIYAGLYRSGAAKIGHLDANILIKEWVQESISNDHIQEYFMKIIEEKIEKETPRIR